MKPSGVLIETKHDSQKDADVTNAFLVMNADDTKGYFFGSSGYSVSGVRLEIPISIEDAIRYNEVATEEVRREIIDTYIVRDRESHGIYMLPRGGYLGLYAVGAVAEYTYRQNK